MSANIPGSLLRLPPGPLSSQDCVSLNSLSPGLGHPALSSESWHLLTFLNRLCMASTARGFSYVTLTGTVTISTFPSLCYRREVGLP